MPFTKHQLGFLHEQVLKEDRIGRALAVLNGPNAADLAKERINHRFLPLHLAVFGASQFQDADSDRQKLVKKLIELYPEAAKEKCGCGGMLPIHYATGLDWDEGGKEIIQALVQAHFYGVEQKDDYGGLPLHQAASNGNLQMVKYLYNLYPEGVKIQTRLDILGNLPLHDAAYSEADTSEVVRYLLSKYPAGAEIPNADGDLPIHRSAFDNLEVSKLLADHYPDGLKHRNNHSKLPIDECSKDVDVFFYLLKKSYPINPHDGILKYLERNSDSKWRMDFIKDVLKIVFEEERKGHAAKKQLEEATRALKVQVQNYREMANRGRAFEKALVAKVCLPEKEASMEELKLLACQLKLRLDLLKATNKANPSLAQKMFPVSIASPDLSREVLLDIIRDFNAEIASLEGAGTVDDSPFTIAAVTSEELGSSIESNRPEKRARVSIS